MKKLIAACVALCATVANCQTVVANTYCSDWSRKYDPVNAGWLVGYMSGLNVISQRNSGRDALKNSSPADLLLQEESGQNDR